MRGVLGACVPLVVAAGLIAQGPAQRAPVQQPAVPGADDARFVTCDVYVDSGLARLAAWQVDVRGTVAGGKVELVGVEGGAPGPFAEPAYHDPEALMRDHVVLAAFSTAKAQTLPVGSSRVARLHLRVVGVGGAGERKPVFTCKVVAAADAAGTRIDASVTAMLGDTP